MSDVSPHQPGEAAQNGFAGKDSMQDGFTSNYMQQSSQPGYGFQPTEQQYIQNYYGQMQFPSYVGEWSTGGESVPYLSAAYGGGIGTGEAQRSFMQDPMFGQQTNSLGNGQAYFNAPVFQQGNEFTAWTSPTAHNSGLDVNIRHQTGTSNYNGDFSYQPILPSMPQDYLERNDYGNTQNTIGSFPSSGHAPQGGFMSGLSSGDGMNKMPGTSNSIHLLEHGMQSLTMPGVGAGREVESVMPKAVQVPISSGPPHVENTTQRLDYGTGSPQAPMKLGAANSVPSPAPPTNKPISWAAIASKPAKPQAKPKPKANVGLPPPIKHGVEAGNWEARKTPPRAGNNSQVGARNYGWNASKSNPALEHRGGDAVDEDFKSEKDDSRANSASSPGLSNDPVLDKLRLQNEYNPKRLTMDLRNSRFFVIKSYSEDDIHRSIKYNIWCSTEHGNKRLDATFRAQKNRGPVILLYSVNGSGHFCGVAEMKTSVDYSSRAGVWSQDKWKGKFQVRWIYVKDVPNTVLRHIRLENNENKPVTNSRDTQEVPAEKGRQVLKIIANYKHQTSIFDDFGHYERRQQEEETQKNRAAQAASNRERKSGEYQQNQYTAKNSSA